jgi:hypothetical protein
MLYLDQPVQVGLSYDSLTNVTSNLDTGTVKVANFTNGVPAQNNSVCSSEWPQTRTDLEPLLPSSTSAPIRAKTTISPPVVQRAPHERSGISLKSGSRNFLNTNPTTTKSLLLLNHTAVAMDRLLQPISKSRTSAS